MAEQLYTLDELAEFLNLSRRTLYRILKIGDLPAYRVGGQLRFKREDIDAWLLRNQLKHEKTD